MKKQYIAPAMQVEQIAVCNVIAASINGTNAGVGYGGTTSGSSITSGNAKSREDVDDDNITNGWIDGLW